jgi:hypothetical protein
VVAIDDTNTIVVEQKWVVVVIDDSNTVVVGTEIGCGGDR